MQRVVVALSILGLFSLTQQLPAQTIEMKASAPSRPAESGWHPWYEMHVDPDNANNMIMCGTKESAKDNAVYGFVYFSGNSGNTWTLALEDKSSVWVTEQSCAYGVHGVAYFVSDASKVIDEEFRHDLGTTRIYTSLDSGMTWKVGLETGWTDASTSVVDTTPGPNQNRLYVFFHDLSSFLNSIGQRDAARAEREGNDGGTRVGMISYKDGDAQIAGPTTSAEMAKENNHGAYPGPAFLLKDGTILTFYTTRHLIDEGSLNFTAEVVQTSNERNVLKAPVKILDSPIYNIAEVNDHYCGYFYDTAGAYDPIHDRLYFVYADIRNKTCHLFLTTSTDDGRSWSKPRQLVSPDETAVSEYKSLTIGVNREEVLGVMWEQRERAGCWMFATSTRDGSSLTRAKELGKCSEGDFKPSALNTAYLLTSIFQSALQKPSSAIRINLRNTQNAVWRNEEALAVTPDGTFHPVWIDAGTGTGAIRTTAVHVASAEALIATATRGLDDLTGSVLILYGGDQSYDEKTKTITLNIMIKNDSNKPIDGPFKLAVPAFYKDYGYAEIANAQGGITDGGAVWDISASIPTGRLNPGAVSKTFPLEFRYLLTGNEERRNDDILGLDVRIFARSRSNPEGH